jgi:hypothetical protein
MLWNTLFTLNLASKIPVVFLYSSKHWRWKFSFIFHSSVLYLQSCTVLVFFLFVHFRMPTFKGGLQVAGLCPPRNKKFPALKRVSLEHRSPFPMSVRWTRQNPPKNYSSVKNEFITLAQDARFYEYVINLFLDPRYSLNLNDWVCDFDVDKNNETAFCSKQPNGNRPIAHQHQKAMIFSLFCGQTTQANLE